MHGWGAYINYVMYAPVLALPGRYAYLELSEYSIERCELCN